MRIRDLAEEVVSPAEAFVNAVCAQATRSSELPYVLSYFPVASMNPFQRLLYSRAAECGFAIVPTLQINQLGRVHWRGRSVLHLHWLTSVLKDVDTRRAAEVRIASFQSELTAWRAAGHKLVWSMHNVLPHDCLLPEAELALRRTLVEGVDAIHVLSRASVEEARKLYDVPDDKIFHTPHPSYEDWYANVDDPVSARLDLDLPAASFNVLFFGSLQPYKGVIELIDAFTRLRERHPTRQLNLVIAGKPVDADYVERIHGAVLDNPAIRFIPSAMEERQIQVLFNAADVVAAPYRRTLNSGVAMLTATFRKSLVAPRAGGVYETFAKDPSLLYGSEPGDGLFEALERSLDHQVAPEIFDEILHSHHPARISKEFFSQLAGHVFAQATATA
ncbi:glycosyltransferase [Luteimonas lutimaris]|uniref:Glycosyltransferase n=1 Tax=Luteimonas lutimaris TaxID=698645 RepID=A0ABP7MWM5_9GAMM